MKKKIILVTIFFVSGIANSFCNENPLIFLDFNKELKIDSLKPILEEKGYSIERYQKKGFSKKP